MDGEKEFETGECSNNSSASTTRKRLVRCYCEKPAKLLKSWTDDNPGRRFYACAGYKTAVCCDFFEWHDKEKVYGWPKTTLLEASDEIRTKMAELNKLSRIIRRLEDENRRLRQSSESEVRSEFAMEVNSLDEGFKHLKTELLNNQSEKKKLEKKYRKLEGRNYLLKRILVLCCMVIVVFMFMCMYLMAKLISM